MVILAGVAIAVAVGDDGVITRAQTATDAQKYKTAREQVETQCVYVTEGENIGKVDLNQTLDNVKELNLEEIDYSEEKTKIEGDSLIVTLKNGEIITIGGDNGEVEYKVYGTKAAYVIVSSENDVIFVVAGEAPIKMNVIIKDKEEYLVQLPPEKAELIKIKIEEKETKLGTSADNLYFNASGDLVAVLFGNTLYIIHEDIELELNEGLAKKVIIREGTYQFFGSIEGGYLANYNDNTCTFYYKNDDGYGYASLESAYIKNTISENEETITIYDVEGKEIIIGEEAKKVERQIKGQSEVIIYYIKGDKLYTDNDQSSVDDGENNCVAIPLIDVDLSEFGMIVIE